MTLVTRDRSPSTFDARQVAVFRLAMGSVLFMKGIALLLIVQRDGSRPPTSLFEQRIPWEIPTVGPPIDTVLLGLWIVLAVLLILGVAPRLAAAAIALIGASLVFGNRSLYSNHLYLMMIATFLLAFMHLGKTGTLWRMHVDTGASVPGWPIFLSKLQLTIVYVFAALSKLNEDYLSGYAIHFFIERSITASLVPDGVPRNLTAMVTVAIVVIVAEIAIALGLWSERWRRTAVLLGVPLHLTMIGLGRDLFEAWQLGIFAATVFALYTLFPDRGASKRHRVSLQSA